MSKIQDAIRKLKAGDSEPEHYQKPVVAPNPVGKMVDEIDSTGVRMRSGDGGLISVDRDSLRKFGYLPPDDQQRHMAEEYRILKRPLLDNALGRGASMEDNANLIMITSALPGDGKTFNCINLALCMAMEKDGTVLLVDADLAKRHISELFGLDDRPGLNDLLRDENTCVSDFVVRTDVPGLRILPAGSPDQSSTELLASQRMRRVIDEISTTYADRVAVFDSPPILVTSEARVLAGFMGQIAMVVCSGKTPQQAVLNALEKLEDDKAVSLILNQAAPGRLVDGYGYGYGNYGYGA